MRKSIIVQLAMVICGVSLLGGCEKTPRDLVKESVQAVGGRDKLYALRDVEYEYTYHKLGEDKKDVSLERYVFDGELSWAKYSVRENTLPNLAGEMVQGYDGQGSWCTLDGKLQDDHQVLRMTDFARKTNFYWFTMMFKLLDPGLNYEGLGKRIVDGTEYEIVKVTFGENVGDAQDTYVLYINPKTHLVDQFLFTVMDFKIAEPLLMKVEYEDLAGLKLATRRKYIKSNWDGEITGETWTEEISSNVKVHNGFDLAMFQKPVAAMSSKGD